MAFTQSLTLNSNIEMPLLGLGTWQSEAGEEVERAVHAALNLGYRHIDTAMIYKNEESVGKALRENDVPREDVFITTKLWNDDQGYDSALRAFDASMERLGLETLDLYLIHWPQPKKDRLNSWKALERLYEDGRVRAIGVSNYMTHHLEEVLARANVPPAVNQIELHPYNFASRTDTIATCRENDIAITAYSPLARADHMDDPKLNEIADKHNRTPAQIMLRWLLEKDIIVIPKSVNPGRIEENSQIFDFELDDADADALVALDDNLIKTIDPMTMP